MTTASNNNINEAVEALYDLHVGVIGKGSERHEKPHKPVLLLAVLDFIAKGKATPDRVPWTLDIRERFTLYFEQVKKPCDQNTPENPFLFLRKEKWWQPVKISRNGDHPLEATPTVGDATAGTVFARVSAPISTWLLQPLHRLRLREALISRFFPQARDRLERFFQEPFIIQDNSPEGQENCNASETGAGRSSGFRRKILEIYDYQCAACGLRIKLPQVGDLTFVDAAHIIPFEEGQNDYPTNGIALCKNHHWAMDRFIIAPSPTGLWKVSAKIDARRSIGEKELRSLHNTPILKPSEEAFYPEESALEWRCARLIA